MHEKTRRRWRVVVITILAVSAITHGSVVLMTFFPAPESVTNRLGAVSGGDFLVFYTAAVMTLKGAANEVWNPAVFDAQLYGLFGYKITSLEFFYPPVALLLWAPFALFPFKYALWLWVALPLIAFGWCIYRLTHHWLATILTLIAPLTVYTAGAGQTGILFAALTAAFVINLERKPILSGSIASLFVVKPHLAPAILICLLVDRNWRAFGVLVTVALALIATVTGLFGLEIWFSFMKGISFHADEVFDFRNRTFDRSLSIQLFMLRLGASSLVAWSTQAIVSLVTAGLLIKIWREAADPMQRLFALSLAICLLSPKILHYDAVVLLIPIAMVIARLEGGTAEWSFVLLSMTIWVLPLLVPLFKTLGFNPVGPVLFVGMVLVFFKSRKAVKATPAPEQGAT
jgi:hypothetical protein